MIEIVDRTDDERVFLAQAIGHVEGERVVAARMASQMRAVQPYVGQLIDRAEMQQHARLPESLRQPERRAIEKARSLGKRAVNAGKQRLRRKRHADFFRKRCGRFLRALRGKIPPAVETEK